MSREQKIELLVTLIERLPEREKNDVICLVKSIANRKGENNAE